MNLGVQLRTYRKSKGHSVQKVAELTGIPADRIYKWEKGTRPSDAEDLLKIRAYMGEQMESKPKTHPKELESGQTMPFKTVLPLPDITSDPVAILTRWREDIEAKYQDSNKRELALIEALKSIGANLSQGQLELKEQIFVTGDHLAQLLSGLRADLAGGVPKKGNVPRDPK